MRFPRCFLRMEILHFKNVSAPMMRRLPRNERRGWRQPFAPCIFRKATRPIKKSILSVSENLSGRKSTFIAMREALRITSFPIIRRRWRRRSNGWVTYSNKKYLRLIVLKIIFFATFSRDKNSDSLKETKNN